MPRQARLILPGVAVHIIQRGNNRGACFRETSDYLVYLACLSELSAKLECRMHAYCLMTNHVHLLLTPPSVDACISLMRNLGQRYVQYFNRRHARTGTLWEGRFRSCVAESARYVLACYRYIELNPVRAGMVNSPADYAWSSHAANGSIHTRTFLSPHAELIALGEDSSSRHTAYRLLFSEEMDSQILAEIREATNGGYPLISDSLKTAISAATARRLERGKAGRPPRDPAGDDDGSKQTGLFPEIGL
jgi:putative transposase